MPRYRTIKPDFWSDEKVVECSTNARLLFVGLWNFVDDSGRIVFAPKSIKGKVFPCDDFTVDDVIGWIDELIEQGLLWLCQVGDSPQVQFLQVVGWHHQKIDKPGGSKFPNPFDDHSLIIRRPFDDHSALERSGEERSREEGSREERSGEERKGKKRANRNSPNYPRAFSEFWKAFPAKRRTKKPQALATWNRKMQQQEDPDEFAKYLIRRARDYAASHQGQSEFVRGPEPWLNQEAWQDPPEAWADSQSKTQSDFLNSKMEDIANGISRSSDRCVDAVQPRLPAT